MLYSLDILSPQPSLCVFGEEKYRTKIGTFISLVVILASIGFGLYFLYEFFIRANIGLVYMKETHDYVDHFNLSDSLFMLYLDERFDESVVQMEVRYNIYNDPKTERKAIEMTQCEKNVTIPKEYNTILPDEGLSDYLCFKPGQNITIHYADVTKNSVGVILKLCDIDINPNCKTHQEILDLLTGDQILFEVLLANNNIDHYNESNPLQPLFIIRDHYSSLEYHYVLNFYWEILTYNTDVGYIFENIKTDLGVYLDSALTVTTVTGRSIDDFSSILTYYEFALYPYYSEKYTRTYEKLQNVIANIGGILSVVETVGVILCDFLTGNMLFTLLAKNVVEDKNIYKPVKQTFRFRDLYNKPVKEINDDEEKPKKEVRENNQISSLFLYSRRNKLSSTTANVLIRDSGSPSVNEVIEDKKSDTIELKDNIIYVPSVSEQNDNNNKIKKTITQESLVKKNTKSEEKEKTNPFNIRIFDYFFYNFGCKRMRGSSIIEISEKITKESLSCEQIIKNNINQQKLIKILNETQKEEFEHMKPELIKQIEQRYMIFSVLIAKSIEEVNKKQ